MLCLPLTRGRSEEVWKSAIVQHYVCWARHERHKIGEGMSVRGKVTCAVAVQLLHKSLVHIVIQDLHRVIILVRRHLSVMAQLFLDIIFCHL